MSVDKRVGVLEYRRHQKHRRRDDSDDFDPYELMDNEEASFDLQFEENSPQIEDEVPERMEITSDKRGRAIRVIVYNDDDSINRTIHHTYGRAERIKSVAVEYPNGTVTELQYIYDSVGRVVRTSQQVNGQVIQRDETEYLRSGDGIARMFNSKNELFSVCLIQHGPDGEPTCHEVPMEQWDSVAIQATQS